MIPKRINQNNESLRESIARMEAELQDHKDFIKFMQEESERMNAEALTNQPIVELETIRK